MFSSSNLVPLPLRPPAHQLVLNYGDSRPFLRGTLACNPMTDPDSTTLVAAARAGVADGDAAGDPPASWHGRARVRIWQQGWIIGEGEAADPDARTAVRAAAARAAADRQPAEQEAPSPEAPASQFHNEFEEPPAAEQSHRPHPPPSSRSKPPAPSRRSTRKGSPGFCRASAPPATASSSPTTDGPAAAGPAIPCTPASPRLTGSRVSSSKPARPAIGSPHP